MEQLKPLLDSSLPKLPSLPKFPSLTDINRIAGLPHLPPWSQQDTRDAQMMNTENQNTDTVERNQHTVHRFYPIMPNIHPSHQTAKKRRKHNRPRYGSPQDGQNHPGNHYSPHQINNRHGSYTYDPPGNSQHHLQHHTSDDRFPRFPDVNRPMKNQRYVNRYQNRPLQRFQGSHNQHPGAEENNQYYQVEQQSPVDQRRPARPQRRPTKSFHQEATQTTAQPYTLEQSHHPQEEQNWNVQTPVTLTPQNNQAQTNKVQPFRRKIRPNHYQNHPHRQGHRPDHDPHNKADLQQSLSSYYYAQFQTNYPPNRYDNTVSQQARPYYPDSSSASQGVIDRLANVEFLSSPLAIPGSFIVIALALAVFYFNFMWYPTPVVTAKLVKLLADSSPEAAIDREQQKAIGEVYEVFRSFETEYVEDPSLWSPACKSRLVCQVHQEMPGLWRVTEAYAALVRSRLATGPAGDEDFSIYLEAAWRGTSGSPCLSHYTSCRHVPAIPVKDALHRLSDILQDLNNSR